MQVIFFVNTNNNINITKMNIDSISPLLIQQVVVIPLIARPSTDLNNPSWTSVRNYVQNFYDYNQTIRYDTIKLNACNYKSVLAKIVFYIEEQI